MIQKSLLLVYGALMTYMLLEIMPNLCISVSKNRMPPIADTKAHTTSTLHPYILQTQHITLTIGICILHKQG